MNVDAEGKAKRAAMGDFESWVASSGAGNPQRRPDARCRMTDVNGTDAGKTRRLDVAVILAFASRLVERRGCLVAQTSGHSQTHSQTAFILTRHTNLPVERGPRSGQGIERGPSRGQGCSSFHKG